MSRGEARLQDERKETETESGTCITRSVKLKPRRGTGVCACACVCDAVKRKRRAELSSLQSSLNCTNRICYCCNGRNKGREAVASWRWLAVHFGVCVCVPPHDRNARPACASGGEPASPLMFPLSSVRLSLLFIALPSPCCSSQHPSDYRAAFPARGRA